MADQSAEERPAETDFEGADRSLVRHADQAARSGPRVLVVGCGALARELVELTRPLPNVDRNAALRLGLEFEHRHTGHGELADSIRSLGVVAVGAA